MKGLLLTLLVTATTVVGGAAVLQNKGIKLPFSLPHVAIGTKSAVPVPISSGEVMGEQTATVTHFGDRLVEAGSTVGKLASVLGVQAVKTTQAVVNNVTTAPTSPSDVIDVSTVVRDISSRVESIPGNLVSQAKVEYCKQVLQAATSSAAKN